MNIKKVEKQAKKINQLLANIKEEGHVSKIEKDLLLSYIRDMYEKVLHVEEDAEVIVEKAPVHIHTAPKVETPKVQISEVVHQEVKEAAKVVIPEPVEVAEVSIPEPIYTPEPAYTAPVVSETPEEKEEVEEEVRLDVPMELLDLFAPKSINELSDKLSRAPISDLTKCMGINEKIFTVQELFGGDSNLFSDTMKALDDLSTLEQARDYLVTNVANDQNWADASKIKKAANFISLISRRY